jgi:hypothetical protein
MADVPRILNYTSMPDYHAMREAAKRSGVRRRLLFRSDGASEGEDDAASQEATIPDLSLSPGIVSAMIAPDPMEVTFAHRVAGADATAPIDWHWLSTLNRGQH